MAEPHVARKIAATGEDQREAGAMAASNSATQRDLCACDGELMPRWRGPEVMEDDANAMGYVCHQCGRDYLPGLVQNRKLKNPRRPS